MEREAAETGRTFPPRPRRKLIFAPVRLMVVLICSVFIIELLVMMLLDRFSTLSQPAANVVDSIALVLLLFPVLYIFVQKPLLHLLEDYGGKEEELLAYHSALEEKVAQRTRELSAVVRLMEQEILERHKAEEALSESEDCFRRIFEQNDHGIILFAQSDGTPRDANPAAETIFGLDRKTLLSGGILDLCTREDSQLLQEALDALREKGEDREIPRLELCPSRGPRRLISFRGKVMQLRGEKILYTTFHDITERMRLEEEAQELQGRLIHTNRMTSLGILVSSVAHEINNPGNYILINARLLKQAWGDLDPVLQERFRVQGDFPVGQTTYAEAEGIIPDLLDGIVDGAQRITSIVDNLKRFGRDERRGSELPVDVNEVVSISSAMLNHHITRYTRHFSVDPGQDLPRVRGNALQLEQVVINLIVNALHSLEGPQGEVRVRTSLEPGSGMVLLQVADTGCGIPPEVATRIMEPFFTTRLEQGGTGLGLAISSAIVKDSGGSLEFQTQPGKGTVFTLRLAPAALSGITPVAR